MGTHTVKSRIGRKRQVQVSNKAATLFFSTRHQAFGASFVAAQAKHFVEDLLVLV